MHIAMFFLLPLVSFIKASSSEPVAVLGPYATQLRVYSLNSDIKNPEEDKVSVWYPSGLTGRNDTLDESTKFKFISYAHGMFGGGALEIPAYNQLLGALASFGYIIGATHQCSVGCFDDCVSLQLDPPCFGNYYKKQLAVFDWAKVCSSVDDSCREPFVNVDWSSGVGIAGHSMGGQATLFSSSYGNASAYDIKAAVLHHAFTHTFPASTVPFLDFTGEQDTTAPVDTMAVPIYKASQNTGLPRGLVDKTLAGHHEPDILSLDRNGIDLLAQYSAAWFKLYLDKRPTEFGLDFDNMIYGSGEESMCGGGDGDMTVCTVER
jgi:hypothetical protein